MKEGKDYLLVEDDLHPDQFLIQLTSSGYAGIVYRYGKVSIIEEKNQARLKFVYQIKSVPDILNVSHAALEKDPVFKNHIGEILADILSNNNCKIGRPND
jgi:hypothetical protein